LGCQAHKGSVDSVFQSILAFGELLEIVLQVAQGVGYSWGVFVGSDISFGAECSEDWSLLVEGDWRVAVH